MTYNAKLLARANARLAEQREKNKIEQSRRLSVAYRKIPALQEIDDRLRSQMVELARLAFSKDEARDRRLEALKEENLSLQMRRAELLVENGYPITWLDEIFSCPLCHDSGRTDKGVCSCLDRLYNQELTLSLSALLKTGEESFDRFDLSLYPEEYSDYFKCAPREYMNKVYSYCRNYAESFPAVREDLLLQGDPGLGKTYLSACIAREVAGRGYSVCYDSAVSAFSAFERSQFARSPEDAEAAGETVRRMLECDLMILDDLGTEVVTQMVNSALYTLINTRANSKKRTIISTTLFPDDLAARYSPSICSRIEGFFKPIRFAGNDIRILLKNRK
ncbi:MAG: ATP-binding protein [Oscillospiraceae bacterium]|nr:ATP-binding protein [Oscillospiraceae bacterium]